MSRLALRYVIQNQRSIPLAGAVVDVFLTTTITPVANMWTLPQGGALVSRLTSDDTGTIRGWFDAPAVVDLKVSDNTHTAHQSDDLILLSFALYTKVGVAVIDPNTLVIHDATDGHLYKLVSTAGALSTAMVV